MFALLGENFFAPNIFAFNDFDIFIYYINTGEIQGELSRVNMISSHIFTCGDNMISSHMKITSCCHMP